MRTLLPAALALLLVSCGRSTDPAFVAKTGDFGAFLDDAICGNHSHFQTSNSFTASWSYRVLTGRHQSGEYLDGRQALQVATAKTNFVWVESFLTQELGAPSMPLRLEEGWRHVGWSRSDPKVGVWLIEDKDLCKVEILKEPSRGEP